MRGPASQAEVPAGGQAHPASCPCSVSPAGLSRPGRPWAGTCLGQGERGGEGGSGPRPREEVHGVPRPGRNRASIFKPKWGPFLPVSRSKCSLLYEQPQRPRTPWPPRPPLALDCCYLKASWSGPEKGVIGGLGDERAQPRPVCLPSLRGQQNPPCGPANYRH